MEPLNMNALAPSPRLAGRDLVVPVVLLLLTAVPLVGGIARLISLSSTATVQDARFHAAPIPVVLHLLSAAVYALVGAFQFSSGFRRRWPRWHRRAGRFVALCGLSVALTGIWMTAFYPIPVGLQGPILYSVRLMVGVGMAAAIVLAWLSIRRRDVAGHEAWMIRAYALAQGAGTQAVIFLPLMAISGDVTGLARDLLMTLAWAINLLCAEWIIRRRPHAARVHLPAADSYVRIGSR
jgi:uncharacterized membrane protein YozB (DUF420 family)